MSKVYCLVDCVRLKLLPVVWNSSLFSSLDQNQLKHAVCKNTPLNSLQQSNKKEFAHCLYQSSKWLSPMPVTGLLRSPVWE